MSADGIFLLRDGDKQMIAMSSAAFESEDVLQLLVADHPDLLAGGQMNRAEPRRWLLLSREMGVPKIAGGPDHWSVDHLLVDQDAVPTIVEVKRSSDTRIRREVVGQVLDYAANGPRYWTADDLRARLERTLGPDGGRAQDRLDALTGDPNLSLEEFLSRVEENLRTGHVRLVFLADVIPDELRSIVEFLNSQMSPAEVFAVEVQQYAAPGVRTLIPRVVGATTLAKQRKQPAASPPYEELLATASAAARDLEQKTNRLGLDLGLETRVSAKARQVVYAGKALFQTYPVWGPDGALEVSLNVIRSHATEDLASKVRLTMEEINGGRRLTDKYPWLDGQVALSGWDRFRHLMADVVIPTLRAGES